MAEASPNVVRVLMQALTEHEAIEREHLELAQGAILKAAEQRLRIAEQFGVGPSYPEAEFQLDGRVYCCKFESDGSGKSVVKIEGTGRGNVVNLDLRPAPRRASSAVHELVANLAERANVNLKLIDTANFSGVIDGIRFVNGKVVPQGQDPALPPAPETYIDTGELDPLDEPPTPIEWDAPIGDPPIDLPPTEATADDTLDAADAPTDVEESTDVLDEKVPEPPLVDMGESPTGMTLPPGHSMNDGS